MGTLLLLLTKIEQLKTVFMTCGRRYAHRARSTRYHRLYAVYSKTTRYLEWLKVGEKDSKSPEHLAQLAALHKDLRKWMSDHKPWTLVERVYDPKHVHFLFIDLANTFVDYTKPLLRYHIIRKSVTKHFEQHHSDCRIGDGA